MALRCRARCGADSGGPGAERGEALLLHWRGSYATARRLLHLPNISQMFHSIAKIRRISEFGECPRDDDVTVKSKRERRQAIDDRRRGCVGHRRRQAKELAI